MTRVLVIGAGHNGLVAAVHLLAAGADVTVLEHAPRPGGASASGEVTLPGLVNDHCAAFAPMTVASPVMQELDLDIDWVTPDVVMAHPFPDGTAIALHRWVQETARSAGPQWERAMAQLVPRGDTLVKAVLSPLPPVRPGVRLALGLRNTLPEWTRRMAGSIEALGLDLFEGDRRAAPGLGGSAPHSRLPPTAPARGGLGLPLPGVRATPRRPVPPRG